MESTANMTQAHQLYQSIFDNIRSIIKGQDIALRKLLAAFFTGQHVLLEDVPGTGKTILAKTLSASIACDFQRIQFTPDLLPSDIVGVSIFNPQTQAFAFHNGPIFTHILLADEINRASPRTQSALLEAMAEKQVSVDNNKMTLDEIFFVIATQNSIEAHGTYPLPEAQMDRFGLRFSLGYVSKEIEVQMLTEQYATHPLDALQSCANHQDIIFIRNSIKDIAVSDDVKNYIVDIVSATRTAKGVKTGASFRASLTLLQLSQALALFDQSDFVKPDHVQDLAESVLSHRLLLDPQSLFSGRDASSIVREVLNQTPVPV